MLKAPIKIEFMGRFCVRQGDRKIDRFRTYKTGVLLAYLAFYNHTSHPREELIEMLWADCDPTLGRNSLSQSLSSLRRQLEPPDVATGEVLQADRYKIQLNPKTFTTDIADFENACEVFQASESETESSVAFSTLFNLYKGEFLPGFYEDWNIRERDYLQNQFSKILSVRIDQVEKQNDILTAIECAKRAIEIDSLDEEMHLRLMKLYISENKRGQALRQYENLSKILGKELDATPSAEAKTLFEKLKLGNIKTVKPKPKTKITKPNKTKITTKDIQYSGILTLLVIEFKKEKDKKILNELVQRFEGNKINENSNLIAATYKNASDAFDCAIKIQRTFDDKTSLQKSELLPQIALGLGEIKDNGKSNSNKQVRYLMERTRTLLKCANCGQFLCAETAAVLLLNNLEPNVRLKELGNYHFGDKDKTERIYQADYKNRTLQIFPPINAKSGNENTLPIQLSRFFGREAEVKKLCEWLKPNNQETRLVTMTGPGGTGKTRLSLEVAKNLQESYRNLTWFIPLAAVKEPHFIPNAILEAMRLESPVSLDSMDFLVSKLSGQKSLLILDNFEQLLSAKSSSLATESAKIVQTLLTRVPDLSCLITSRRRLGVFGEKEFFLEPLNVPYEQDTLEEINLCDSVQMLIDRAQAVRPTFQLTKNNANVISKLCRNLEGIPLALELAAAQLQILTPSQILKGLSRRLDFLTDRRHQAEERHQQLRATIDWSFEMLPKDVQKFFASLSTFRDGGNLSDVETICDDPLALDHLALLQESSFLRVEENSFADEMRFQLLETLREYGEDKLDDSDLRSLREKHLQTYLKLAEQAAPLLKSEGQTTWFQRLEHDHQNFLFALDWCIETKNIENGLRLSNGLYRFWKTRGYIALGSERLNEFLDSKHRKSASPEIISRSLSSAGNLALTAWDFASAEDFYTKCLKLARGQKDISLQAEAIKGLGQTAYEQGNYKTAYNLLQECLELWLKLDDDFGVAGLLNSLGLIASEQGDYQIAVEHYHESLALRRKIGDKVGIAVQLNNIGIVNRRRGNYKEAKIAIEESLEIRRELGDRRNIAASLSNLSWVAENERKYEKSRIFQEESFLIREELGDDWGIALSHNIFGILARHQGDNKTAANYFEKSLKIRRRIGNKLGIAETQHRLGDLFSSRGKFKEAEEYLQESLEFMSKSNNRLGLSEVLEAYSRMALKKEKYANSTKLFFAANAIRKSIGATSTPSEKEIHKTQLKQLKLLLTQKAFQQAKKQGVSMSIKRATELATKT